MHATLAFLNAAGRRTTRPTPGNPAFMRVMNALLAIVPSSLLAAPRRKPKSKKGAEPQAAPIPGQRHPTAVRHI